MNVRLEELAQLAQYIGVVTVAVHMVHAHDDYKDAAGVLTYTVLCESTLVHRDPTADVPWETAHIEIDSHLYAALKMAAEDGAKLITETAEKLAP